MRSRVVGCVLALLSLNCISIAQLRMDQEKQEALVGKVLSELREKYPFPEITAKLAATLQQNLNTGAYAKIADPDQFALRLTQDLQEVSHDRHISLSYSADKLEVRPINLKSMYVPKEDLKRIQQEARASNFGTTEVRILDGNVGYIRFDVFAPLPVAAETYVAALRFVANTDALIFDLRNCGGANDPDAIPFIAGYLFEHPVHMTDFYLGSAKTPRQLWSAEHVPGPTFYDVPVHVVTSRATFSGCEAFAYELQALKRATVVGEVTGGGGNPNAIYPIDEHFSLSTPIARIVNPTTGMNWNEKGVQPDVPAERAEALHKAHVGSLQALLQRAPEERKKEYADKVDDVRSNPPRVQRVSFRLPGHEKARQVALLGSFNGFVPWSNPMKQSGNSWTGDVLLEPGSYWYLFLVDGEYVLDPANPTLNRDKRANVLKVQ